MDNEGLLRTVRAGPDRSPDNDRFAAGYCTVDRLSSRTPTVQAIPPERNSGQVAASRFTVLPAALEGHATPARARIAPEDEISSHHAGHSWGHPLKIRHLDSINGALLIEHVRFIDDRGEFVELSRSSEALTAGMPAFVQDSLSISRKGVLRGMHFQKSRPQGHWVNALRGTVFDAAVDLRRDSPTFRCVACLVLDSRQRQSVYWPPGVAHGFYVQSDEATLLYKLTGYYEPGDESGISWRDPELSIPWPLDGSPLLKPRDEGYPCLSELVPDDYPSLKHPTQG